MKEKGNICIVFRVFYRTCRHSWQIQRHNSEIQGNPASDLKTTFMRNILWCWRRIRIFNSLLWFNLWFIKTLKWTIQNASLGIEKSRQHSLISSVGLCVHRFVVIYVPSLSSPQALPASRKANTFQRWVYNFTLSKSNLAQLGKGKFIVKNVFLT